ncbi:P-loop containing nucleoside triphosphate hydrolase protein [Dothidotthia symphoricarpi CBS 119687]|uniref:P-loop containing nucleoside triphosphate hydrolase protein n=1 Tax=Dothidotthia symphoricarpi CBS 119687 TaxID=1392245 RepID=A0A6A6AIA3_9PLEO|nr:P-loop containing nucleoside triphosphate hydrolase protein [Dothidotthia symphoricarpi CBS 119687]KAF2130818.1 P-loop containing nucleoside triphosphate hydrolase protein [Dothidotthia symphoricarpi CBS 119687]
MSQLPPLILAISGPSSSGKTTLSRLLRSLSPAQTSILHLDDFYLPDTSIPVKNGIQDWDCLESLDLPLLEKALHTIKSTGQTPDWLVSKEDQNSVGEHGVPEAVIQEVRQRVKEWGGRRIHIIDGFLLFSRSMPQIQPLFDIKLFLRTSYSTAKARREARSGYVTLEGFWADPPGYVDAVVWPNYVADHQFLFRNGQVDDELDEEVCGEMGIWGMPRDAEENMEKCFRWAVEVLEGATQKS